MSDSYVTTVIVTIVRNRNLKNVTEELLGVFTNQESINSAKKSVIKKYNCEILTFEDIEHPVNKVLL